MALSNDYKLHGIPTSDPSKVKYGTYYDEDSSFLCPWGLTDNQVSYWSQWDSWTALEAALLIAGVAPDVRDLYAVSIEHYQIAKDQWEECPEWRYEEEFGLASDLLNLFQRSILLTEEKPATWVKHALDKQTKGFKPSQKLSSEDFFAQTHLNKWAIFFKLLAPEITSDDENQSAQLTKGVTKKVIQSNFAGLHFDYDHWGANLADAPDWLIPCRVAIGSKRWRVSHTWNPVLIGMALLDKKIPLKRLDLVFMGLKDWKDEWHEKTDLER